MKTIDEQRLDTDLAYRFEYLAEFIGFGPEDRAAIQASGPHLGPLIPQIVEKTYDKLLAYDATARHFLPKQSGFDGAKPAGLPDLAAGHPQVQFRKEHLGRYFTHILSRMCDPTMAPYLEMVGKIHTQKAGNPEIDVPLIQMNALMGYLTDVVAEMIQDSALDPGAAWKTCRAFSKLFWIQNDFIARQYLVKA
jgi:hypothetical protein